jgi:ATP-binding cassette subfamily B multidrug efflux pump
MSSTSHPNEPPSSTPPKQVVAAARRSRVEVETLRAANDPLLARMLDEERVESEVRDQRMLLRLLSFVRPHGWIAALSVLLAFAEAIAGTLPPFIIGYAVDRALGSERPPGVLDRALESLIVRWADWAPQPEAAPFVVAGVVIGLMWLLKSAIGSASLLSVQVLGQRVVHDVRQAVYNHITSMDLGYFQKNPVGRLVNRATFDVQKLSELFSDAFAEGMRDLLFVIVLLGFLFTLDLPLALVLFLSLPFLLVWASVYRRMARPAMRTHTAVISRMNAWIAENVAGMRENQLYRQEARRAGEFRSLTDAHQASVTHVIRSWGLVRPGLMLTSAFATVALLWVGYGRVLGGLVTVGLLLTFLQYTTRLWVPVRNLAEKLNLIQESLTSAERIADVLDQTPALRDQGDEDASLVPTRGEIRFDAVRYRYPGQSDDVLRALDVHVAPGRMLALVGDTGAGKSTFVSLISRFDDVSEGTLTIDGSDVRSYRLGALRSAIALVPQDVVVFAGSVRDNLTLGRAVTDARIHECLDAVGAHDLVAGFADGLDHVLEESGKTLSAGQRQLLAFTRALLGDPPILILDEATSNIDSETETRIQDALLRLTEGRTSIVIAHRLSTIREADEILVLRHGRIVERGRHDDLLALDGEYRRLHDLHLQATEREIDGV